MSKKITLTCRAVSYLSQGDEDMFFTWIKAIPSIIDFEGWRDELYLYCESDVIPNPDLIEIVALFYRYKVKDMTQLKVFLHDENKEWFFDEKEAYWWSRVFGEPLVKLVCDDAVFTDTADEERFEQEIMSIGSVEELDDFAEKLHVYVISSVIPDDDLKKLLAIFFKCNIPMGQLKVFLHDGNKEWFFDEKEAYWWNSVFGGQALK